MTPLGFVLACFLLSTAAGTLGSLLGLGGGIVVIPALTLLLKIDIRYAIGASIVSVIATSSGAAVAYVKERLTNLRVAMVLEIGTTLGALTGSYLAGRISGRWLHIIFGLMMGYSALMMFRKRRGSSEDDRAAPWADFLRLHSSYYDEALDREVAYKVVRTRVGLGLMYIAGTVSGLLGIGSGALKVPAMDLAMRLPIKVSAATSNFMIGVTAAASAGLYLSRGYIDPGLAMPVMLGVLAGSLTGAKLLVKAKTKSLRLVFSLVIVALGIEMIINGIRGTL